MPYVRVMELNDVKSKHYTYDLIVVVTRDTTLHRSMQQEKKEKKKKQQQQLVYFNLRIWEKHAKITCMNEPVSYES